MGMDLRKLVNDSENYMTPEEAEKLFIQAGYILIPKSNFKLLYSSTNNKKKNQKNYNYTNEINESSKQIKINEKIKAA